MIWYGMVWYGTGQLNSDRMWVVRDRRQYDEATVLNWIASDSASGSSGNGGYPTVLGGAAAISGSSLEQVFLCMFTHIYYILIIVSRYLVSYRIMSYI